MRIDSTIKYRYLIDTPIRPFKLHQFYISKYFTYLIHKFRRTCVPRQSRNRRRPTAASQITINMDACRSFQDGYDRIKNRNCVSVESEFTPISRRGTISCEGAILHAPPDVLCIVLKQLVRKGIPEPSSGDTAMDINQAELSTPFLSKRFSPEVMMNDGLRDAARLGSTCRGWRDAYKSLLMQDVRLSIEVRQFKVY